ADRRRNRRPAGPDRATITGTGEHGEEAGEGVGATGLATGLRSGRLPGASGRQRHHEALNGHRLPAETRGTSRQPAPGHGAGPVDFPRTPEGSGNISRLVVVISRPSEGAGRRGTPFKASKPRATSIRRAKWPYFNALGQSTGAGRG